MTEQIAMEAPEEEEAEEEQQEPVQQELEELGIDSLESILLRVMSDLDPRFTSVAWHWLTEGSLGEALALVISRGFAKDETGALKYLNDFTVLNCTDSPEVSFRGHLSGNVRLKRRPPKGEEDAEKEKQEAPAELMFGGASHRVVTDMMMLKPSWALSEPHEGQLGLFGDGLIPSKELAIPLGTQFVMPILDEMKSILTDEYLFANWNWSDKLTECLNTMAVFTNKNSWLQFNPAANHMFFRLVSILQQVFGNLMYKMSDANGKPDLRYLQMLSYMTWGYAVIHLFSNPSPPFEPSCILPEISVLPHGCGINAGRMDAFQIVSIDGEKPTKEQWKKIANIYFLSEPRPTVGQMILAIYQLFGRDVEFAIIDLKCCIGDAVGEEKIISVETVKKNAINKHVEQVKRYIFFTTVSFHLACMEAGIDMPKDVWKNKPPINTGWLVYLLYNQKPKIYKVRLSVNKQREGFKQRVSFNLHRGIVRAMANDANNVLNQHLRDMAGWRIPRAPETLFSDNGVVFTKASNGRTIFNIAEQYREYYDKEGLVEVVGYYKNGSPILMLHLGRLSASEAWKSGEIISDSFDLPHGGFIRCLNPEHNDSNPSCYLRLLEGRVICYGCGFKAGLMGEITFNGQVMSVSMRAGLRRDSRKKPLTDEHYKIMASAQAILTDSLEGSRGAKYLEERGITLDLAREYGVGFCDSGFIFGMFDRGYSITQLTEHGFIGFSVRTREDSWLVQQIVREYGHDMLEKLSSTKKVAGIMRTAWIYNPMAGRLTFPMSVLGGNRISNFYCRMPYCKDRSWAHRKLNTGAAQGAFNIDTLWWPEDDTIIITEGVFDALSLISLGASNIIAITGLDNPEVLRAIENSGKIIAIALDNDDKGREKTQKLLARFEAAGLDAYDYTKKFTSDSYIDFREGDDFNSWYLCHIHGVNT